MLLLAKMTFEGESKKQLYQTLSIYKTQELLNEGINLHFLELRDQLLSTRDQFILRRDQLYYTRDQFIQKETIFSSPETN